MSLQFAIPSVKDIREGFKHKASSLKIESKPSRLSIRQLRLKLRANLRAIPCLLADILGYGWEFLLMTDDDWILAHHTKEGTDPDDATAAINAIIPPMPIIENPGYFVVKTTWTVDTTIIRKREEHAQRLQSFLWKTNIEQAINLELSEAIPKALLSDYTDDEGTLTTRVNLVLTHLEDTYDKTRPKDINKILKTFTTDYDGVSSVSTYFLRQQECKKLLRKTKEPIQTATMIRTALGHFQRLPYMGKACEEWEDYELIQDESDVPTTWKEFKVHFNRKFLTYDDQQETLQDMGIANSAMEKEKIEDLLNERDATVAALLVDRDNKFEALNEKFEALLASTNSNAIVKPPPAQVNISPNDLMSVMTELTKSLSASSSSSNSKRSNTNRNKGPRLTRLFKTDNYCWSHGSDLAGDHTSANCNNRKTGHQADATIDDRKNGSKRYLALVRPNS